MRVAIAGATIGIILGTIGLLTLFSDAQAQPSAQPTQVLVIIGAPIGGNGLGGGDAEIEFPVLYIGEGVANGGLDFDSVSVIKESTQGLQSFKQEVQNAAVQRGIDIGYTLTKGLITSFDTFNP